MEPDTAPPPSIQLGDLIIEAYGTFTPPPTDDTTTEGDDA